MKEELRELALMLEGIEKDLRKVWRWLCRPFTK